MQLISSHNLAELESFCNKVTIIQNGEIIESSTLEEAKRVEGRSLYDIEVDLAESVKKVLLQDFEIVDENNIKIYISKEEVPQVIENLVNAGIKIYKVTEDLTSLEDAFLKKTAGNVID